MVSSNPASRCGSQLGMLGHSLRGKPLKAQARFWSSMEDASVLSKPPLNSPVIGSRVVLRIVSRRESLRDGYKKSNCYVVIVAKLIRPSFASRLLLEGQVSDRFRQKRRGR